MHSVTFTLLFFQLVTSWAIVSNKTDDLQLFVHFNGSTDEFSPKNSKCSLRIQSSLDKLRKRQATTSSGLIDLSGYALHQTLRLVPFDMYVTDIKVRTPGTGNWVRVEKCHFSTPDNRLSAQIMFNDLAVTGNVRLLDQKIQSKSSDHGLPSESCSMTVRLRRAGLGINAFPTQGRSKGIDVRTEARFVDPNYLSVHAYGCKLNRITRGRGNEKFSDGARGHQPPYSGIPRSYQTNRWKRWNDAGNYFPRPGVIDHLTEDITESDHDRGNASEVRILTLAPIIPGHRDSSSTHELQAEDEVGLNNYHKERLLSAKFQTERDRLKAVLHVKNLIAQQANQVFQAHGPFSHLHTNIQKPLFESNIQGSQNVYNIKPVNVVSTITELDENLSPVRPVHQGPHHSLFSPENDKIVTDNIHNQHVHAEEDDFSREMEYMFLTGIKMLLTKYLEKQLEIPLKEALMVNIGYTVSYG